MEHVEQTNHNFKCFLCFITLSSQSFRWMLSLFIYEETVSNGLGTLVTTAQLLAN